MEHLPGYSAMLSQLSSIQYPRKELFGKVEYTAKLLSQQNLKEYVHFNYRYNRKYICDVFLLIIQTAQSQSM